MKIGNYKVKLKVNRIKHGNFNVDIVFCDSDGIEVYSATEDIFVFKDNTFEQKVANSVRHHLKVINEIESIRLDILKE